MGMVSCMDETIGDIVNTAKERGIWDNTLVIFTTDNGGNPKVGGCNLPLKGKKASYWEGGIRAVGFIHGWDLNNRISGHVSNGLMHVTDWFPTLLNVAGGDFKGIKQLDGYNQWKTFKYGTRSPRQEILHNIDPVYDIAWNTTKFTLRMGAWKLVSGHLDKAKRNAMPHDLSDVVLFNIERDPFERNDLSEHFPNIVYKMIRRMKHYETGMVSSELPAIDLHADPSYHGGFWKPWQK